MSVDGLEQTLRELPRVGKLVKDRDYRQVWRFEHDQRAYYLKFYPRHGVRDRIRRLFRGSPAMAEFTKLQRMQSAGVPSPRPVAALMGFTIADRDGDAVISEAIEPAVPLDQYLNDLELAGEPIPNHLQLAAQVREIVGKLARAWLGHEDLHLGNFLLHDGRLFLLDGYALRIGGSTVRKGGMTVADLMHLGHSVSRFATRTDIIRGWRELGPNRPLPKNNPAAEEHWRDFIRRRVKGDNAGFGKISLNAPSREKNTEEGASLAPSPPYSGERAGVRGDSASDATFSMAPHPNPLPRVRGRGNQKGKGNNPLFGRMALQDWSGSFFKMDKHPRRWSAASRLNITREDWDRELPPLLEKIEKNELKFLKRGRSGDVLATQITLGGQLVDIVIKRPRRRYWYRYINEIGRGTRARREWFKAWKMIVRNLPTAWPLLYVEKRRLGYVTDGLVVFERVPGELLAWAKLDEMPEKARDTLFRRAGRTLRRIDRLGFAHFDAKASNWIVRPDEKLGPLPVMIDIDGIRHRRWTALGILRLLRSMQEHNQYSSADSLALCQGYAPGADMVREGGEDEAMMDDDEAVSGEPDETM